MPMVAERAGVNHSSIYRRWGDVQTMINDLATYRLDPNRPLPASGDLRADLTAWAQEMVEHYRRKPANAAMLRAGAATAGQSEFDCLRNRRAEAATLVESALEPRTVTSDDVIDHIIALVPPCPFGGSAVMLRIPRCPFPAAQSKRGTAC